MAPRDDDPRMIDLSLFIDRETCLELAMQGCPERYRAIAKKYLLATSAMTTGHVFYMSLVSRLCGLHEAVMREITADNPSAVFLLIRGYAETLAIAMYVIKKPTYIEAALSDPKRGGPNRKSIQSIFAGISDEAPGFKAVYGELSDHAHFGPIGVYSAHVIVDDELQQTGWTDEPHWRDQSEFRIACAQIHELAQMAFVKLEEFGSAFLTEPFPTPVIGRVTTEG